VESAAVAGHRGERRALQVEGRPKIAVPPEVPALSLAVPAARILAAVAAELGKPAAVARMAAVES